MTDDKGFLSQVSERDRFTVLAALQEELIGAWEDSLADVQFNLMTDYDPKRLVESMHLAVQLDAKIEFLETYMKEQGLIDDEGKPTMDLGG